MTMATLVSSITTDLRTELGSIPVVKYWRLAPPATLKCYIQPNTELAEDAVAVGNDFSSGWHVDAILEVPWDDKEATAEALDAAVELVKAWAGENREFVPEYVLTLGEVVYVLADRPGGGKPVWAARIPLLFQYPKLG